MYRANFNGGKKASRAFVVALAVALAITAFPLPKVHAFTNNLVWSRNDNTACAGTTYTITFSQPTTQGDPIILNVGDNAHNFISSITDNLGDSWTIGFRIGPGGSFGDSEQWYVSSAVTGTLTTVIVTWSSNAANCLSVIEQMDTGPVARSSSSFSASSASLAYAAGAAQDWGSAGSIPALSLNVATIYLTVNSQASFFASNIAPCGTATIGCGNVGHNGLWTNLLSASDGGNTTLDSCGAFNTLKCTSTAFFFSSSVIASSPEFGTVTVNGAAQVAQSLLVTVSYITGQSPASPIGTQTVGSCPTKDTTTLVLANSTEYFYTTQTVAPGEVVNTMSSFLAAVTSVSASETLLFAIYATPNAGTIGASNPLTLQPGQVKSFVLTAGTKNSALNWNVGFAIPSPAGATMAIALLGNSKITLNQSAFTGLQTAATFGGILTSVTSLTPSANTLFMCATMNYALISTVTSTVTTTSTTTTGGASTSFITNPNAPLALLILGLPTLILGTVTKGNIIGALVGLMFGAIICLEAGVIPDFIFVGIVIVAASLAFVSRQVSSDG